MRRAALFFPLLVATQLSSPAGSKFSRVFFRPSLHNHLFFRVKLHGVASLAMEHAEEAVLPTRKGEVRHGSSHSYIDSNVPCRRFVAEPTRRGPAGGEKRGLISKRAFGQKVERLIQVICVHQTQHRTKYLSVGELAA